jgi:hypothetical protein
MAMFAESMNLPAGSVAEVPAVASTGSVEVPRAREAAERRETLRRAQAANPADTPMQPANALRTLREKLQQR